MRNNLMLPIVLLCSLAVFTGCNANEDKTNQNNVSTAASQSEVELSETKEETPDPIVLTVVCKIDLREDISQLTGEPAENLLSLLNSLTYDKGTCDGLPEYTIIYHDQTEFDLNLTSGWAWKEEKECNLSEDTIAVLSALLPK